MLQAGAVKGLTQTNDWRNAHGLCESICLLFAGTSGCSYCQRSWTVRTILAVVLFTTFSRAVSRCMGEAMFCFGWASLAVLYWLFYVGCCLLLVVFLFVVVLFVFGCCSWLFLTHVACGSGRQPVCRSAVMIMLLLGLAASGDDHATVSRFSSFTQSRNHRAANPGLTD